MILIQSPVPSNQLLKQNTSPVPHFGVATIPDQIEGAIMPPIEEKNCILKSTSEQNSARTSSVSSSTCELPSISQITNNNCNDSMSRPQILESEAQVNVDKKNVSKIIIHFKIILIFTNHVTKYL